MRSSLGLYPRNNITHPPPILVQPYISHILTIYILVVSYCYILSIYYQNPIHMAGFPKEVNVTISCSLASFSCVNECCKVDQTACKDPLKIVFHRGSSSMEGRLPSKVVFHQSLSSTKDRLPLKIVFHRRRSSIEDCLPPKVVFQRRSSSNDGRLPTKVIFQQRLFSTKVVFH